MRRKSVVDRQIRRRFVVTLTEGHGMFSGVLIENDDTTYVFDDARVLTDGDEQPIQGRMYVDRINVAYMQLTGG